LSSFENSRQLIMLKPLAAGLGLALLASSAGFAADIPGRVLKSPAPAPSLACKETAGLPTDVFGFTTGSDVNDLGALSGAIQYNGNYGARFGRLAGHNVFAQLSYSPFPCFEIGPTIQGFTQSAGATTYGLDLRQYGATVEMKYKLLGRATHGFGLTVTTEPGAFHRRYSTLSNAGGFPVFVDPFGNALRPSGTVFSNLARVLLDFELVKDKLFGAINLEHVAIWDDPLSPANAFGSREYFKTSGLNIRASLAYKATDTLFIGVEGSHQRAYLGTFLNRDLGNAWFVGPTFYWQATDKLAISGAYSIQVAGETETAFLPTVPFQRAGGDTDLLNFSRHLAKFKIAYSF
jgi:hypothetical protein